MIISVPLKDDYVATLADINQSISNACAHFAVKNQLLIEEVYASFQGFSYAYKKPVAALYMLGKRKLDKNTVARLAQA